MRLIALLTACALAVALAVPAGDALASGGGGQSVTAVAAPTAKVPPRFRSAYKQWRVRLKRYGVYVGRDLLAGGNAHAAEDGSVGATKPELRHSIHRMQRRWGNWLRHDPQGRVVAFRLKVHRAVPGWGQAQLRSIAWCESKNNPHAIGGGGAYRGLYQFSVSTWAVVGGSGDPAAASRWEQTWRAWLLLSRHGSGHWPICG